MELIQNQTIEVPHSRLNSLLLILIFVFLTSGASLVLLKMIDGYYRDQIYYSTLSALPKHNLSKDPAFKDAPAVSGNKELKIYRNDKYGFEFSYPEALIKIDQMSDSGVSLSFAGENVSRYTKTGQEDYTVYSFLNIYAKVNSKHETLEEYFDERKSMENWNYQLEGYVTIGDLKFLKYSWTHQGRGEHFVALKNNNFIDISFTSQGNYDSPQADMTLEGILKTFKFTN